MKEVTYHLQVFDGPLDLLLHLLSKNKVEIKDIPISEILEQYLEYIRRMQEFDLEVASEFITMAAQLMYIKSKMLLPVYDDDPQEDPRAGLVEALLEYQRIKEAGSALSLRAQIGRDIFVKGQEPLEKDRAAIRYHYTYEALTQALEDIFQRAQRKLPPPVTVFQGIVGREPISVESKIGDLVRHFVHTKRLNFEKLVLSAQSRSEIVAIFLAVLELSRTRKIMIEETEEDGYTLRLATREEQRADALYRAEDEEHDRID
ncbi:MAG: segregation/condensation protein A [Clostridia bacterium]|nr:segregation/condensation protein A [Clostridia bacterium]